MAHVATNTRPALDDGLLPCAASVAAGAGRDLWYPESGREVSAVVVTACARCTWRAACLAEALRRPEEHGIWAGLPPSARMALRQRILLGNDPARVVRDGLAMADRMRLARR